MKTIAWLKEVEKAVIASVVFENDLMDLLETLRSEHFYFPTHKKIYKAIEQLKDKEQPISEHFIRANCNVSDEEMMTVLSAMPITNAVAYASEIIEEYAKRSINQICLETQTDLGAEGNISSSQIKIGLIQKLDAITDGSGDNGRSLQTLADLEILYKDEKEVEKIKAHHKFIDGTLGGGIEVGQLVFVSGKKESGKTYFWTWVMHQMAMNGTVCAFMPYEFGKKTYLIKTADKFEKKDSKRKALFSNIIIEDEKSDILHIEHFLIKAKRERNIKFALIDSLLRITSNYKTYGNMAEAKSDIFSRLGALARKLEIVLAIVVQMDKKSYDDGEPSVLGSINADHEAQLWHLITVDKKTGERNFTWVKNKQNFKRGAAVVKFIDTTENPFLIVKMKDDEGKEIPIAVEYSCDVDIENEQYFDDEMCNVF